MRVDYFPNIEYDQLPKVLSKYGTLVPYGSNGEDLIDIIPGKSRTANTLTTRYGLGKFPYHTDTAYWHIPAKYLVLYCKNPGSGGRETNFIDLIQLCENEDIFKLCKNALFLVKRNFKSFYSSALFKTNNEYCFRYDIDCMEPKNEQANTLAEIFANLDNFSRIHKHKWSTGDLLVINNYINLHSRGSAVKNDADRVLTRALIL